MLNNDRVFTLYNSGVDVIAPKRHASPVEHWRSECASADGLLTEIVGLGAFHAFRVSVSVSVSVCFEYLSDSVARTGSATGDSRSLLGG